MFAPEGYIRWIDLVPEIFDWADRVLLAYNLEHGGKSPSLAFESQVNAEAVQVVRANNVQLNLSPIETRATPRRRLQRS
jgi:hypothetical protein